MKGTKQHISKKVTRFSKISEICKGSDTFDQIEPKIVNAQKKKKKKKKKNIYKKIFLLKTEENSESVLYSSVLLKSSKIPLQ